MGFVVTPQQQSTRPRRAKTPLSAKAKASGAFGGAKKVVSSPQPQGGRSPLHVMSMAKAAMQQQVAHSQTVMERDDLLLYLTAILGVVLPGVVFFVYSRFFAWYYSRKKTESSGVQTSQTEGQQAEGSDEEAEEDSRPLISVFYASETGTSEHLSRSMVQQWQTRFRISATDLAGLDQERFLTIAHPCVFVVSTFIDGQPPEACQWFFDWLRELGTDFRHEAEPLRQMRVGVFGLGNSMYDQYNTVAKRLIDSLKALGAQPFMSLALADESKQEGVEHQFNVWKRNLFAVVSDSRRLARATAALNQQDTVTKQPSRQRKLASEEAKKPTDKACCQGEGDCGDSTQQQTASEGCSSEDDDDDELSDDTGIVNDVIDMEDMGSVISNQQQASQDKQQRPEMVTPVIRASLTKQGYKILGTHSGVKLCRWTKAMVRGRGGCYKHTFYGIESHRCMEATPSLACANKHHTNPTGTEWKWHADAPELIVEQAIAQHNGMVKALRGVPGALPDRLEEASVVRHCALSLVGEPIMYPQINQLLQLLHRRRISTFLVTNAQFPEPMKTLVPVTQLYVSLDAPSKDALKKIDRPLHRDFWERTLTCLDLLKTKAQRTVYRLTLVKDYNTDDVGQYAELVARGRPDLIELKGVTYCGTSKANTRGLSMTNVPWHDEVVSFARALVAQLDAYAIACEHEHSNCILIASTKFRVNGVWHTWIDYEKFHDLVAAGTEFTSVDYMAETPGWALFGSDARGFDPAETRWHRKKRL